MKNNNQIYRIDNYNEYYYNEYGYDQYGYDKNGYTKSGYNRQGVNKYEPSDVQTFSNMLCILSVIEISNISFDNPPSLSNRQFTIAFMSIHRTIGEVPCGLCIGMSIVVKYWLNIYNTQELDIDEQIELFSKRISRYFSSYKNNSEDALSALMSLLLLYFDDNSFYIGLENELATRCVECGEHFDYYYNKAFSSGFMSI